MFCVDYETDEEPWKSWSQNKRRLRAKTGLSISDVLAVFDLCEEELVNRRRKKRKGNGGKSFVSPINMLLITLYWLYKYPSFREVGDDFDIPCMTVSDTIYGVVEIMYRNIVPVFIQPLSSHATSSSYQTLSNVKMIIDSTFLPLPRSKRESKLYHMKSPTKAAVKYELACDLSHQIISVSAAVDGSVHDLTLTKKSGVLNQLPENAKAVADKGYCGNRKIVSPFKRNSRAHKEMVARERTRGDKGKRKELSRQRVGIENINQREKVWMILRGTYRGNHEERETLSHIIAVVSALNNLDMQSHPIRAAK